jgi:hypothetical protein
MLALAWKKADNNSVLAAFVRTAVASAGRN